MQYNGEANDLDICTLADKLAKSSDTSFPLAEKALYANWGLRTIWSWIFQAYGGWIFDDTNNTDEPTITSTLTASQQLYLFATGFTRSGGGTPEVQDLFGASWKDSSGIWNKLLPITLEEIKDRGYAESNFMSTPANPQYYRPVGGGFKIYPASDTTRSAALRAQIADKVVNFAPSDTTAKPGFDSNFHEAVSVFMALQHSKNNSKDKQVASLSKDWDGNEDSTGREGGFKLKIKTHYASKFRENFPGKIRKGSDIVSMYL